MCDCKSFCLLVNCNAKCNLQKCWSVCTDRQPQVEVRVLFLVGHARALHLLHFGRLWHTEVCSQRTLWPKIGLATTGSK